MAKRSIQRTGLHHARLRDGRPTDALRLSMLAERRTACQHG